MKKLIVKDDSGREVKPFYTPTGWEKKLDHFIGIVAPAWAMKREQARQRRHELRYIGAMANNGRQNASPTSGSGETSRGDRERRQLQWNAIELIENVGLAWSIRSKFQNYVCGTIRYQARTGDPFVNEAYESYMADRLGKDCDIARRNTLRQQCRLIVGGQVTKGDSGLNVIVDNDAEMIRFQGIEGDRIGDPYEYRSSSDYIGGVHLDSFGGYSAFDIFTRDRNTDRYCYEKTLPAFNRMGMRTFLMNINPITHDCVRGRTVFKSTIDRAHYIEQIKQFELQALQWASSRSGVYHTKSGQLPDMPFDQTRTDVDQFGNAIARLSITPNTVTALELAEDVKLFEHERPSPNLLAMYRDTVRDIALGCDLSFGFVFDMSGLTGPAVRQASSQDKRSIEVWQMALKENTLDDVRDWILQYGIAKGHIPFHERWRNGQWQFPAHPTIDMGRESTANINEYAAALTSGHEIATEAGTDIETIQQQCGEEARNLIKICKKVAKDEGIEDWREVLSLIKPGKTIAMSPQFEAARAEQLKQQAAADDEAKRDQDRASSDGVEMP